MLTADEFFERRVALGGAIEHAEPYADLPYMNDEDTRQVVAAINDNTRALLAVAQGVALLADLLGPQQSQPRGTFRDLTQDEDAQGVEDARDPRSP